MSENIIRQGYDSNSNASTDLEARQTNTVSLEEEKYGAMFTTNCGFDCNDAAECDCFEQDEDSVDFVLQFDERYEDLNGKIAFCCQNCQCAEDKVYKQIRINCGNSGGVQGFSGSSISELSEEEKEARTRGNTQLYHKGCCHNDKQFSIDYLSPMMRAINKTLDGDGDEKKKKRKLDRSMTRNQIESQYNRAKREETQFENEEYDVDKTSQILTNPSYLESIKIFRDRTKGRKRGLRVLSLFSGIASDTVVLKKLGVPIEAMVHVEHDPIAVYVMQWNHRDDGITHHYIKKFEDIYGDGTEPNESRIVQLLRVYGPFDLVTGAAPCHSLTGINASRNIYCDQAQYLAKTGKLIKRLDILQHINGIKNRVLFLSENVVFKESDKFDIHYSDKIHGLPAIRIDAKDFGPVKRNRLYWLNLPVTNSEHIKDVASKVSVDTCLDNGWESVPKLLYGDKENVVYKANAFLASDSRIDDIRMMGKYKACASTDKYEIQSYSIAEREKMMGLPVGYVEEPIKNLFTELAEKAFQLPETNLGKTYRDFLPYDLWHFRKTCKFKFESSKEPPFFQLLLSSPLEGKQMLAYFTQEQYCKHLIGNGWSIPVVEHLLSKLIDLFDTDNLKTYKGYEYTFPWEPYTSSKK